MATNITGIWSAVLNKDGITVYQSGTVVQQGPVQLTGGATLYVTSGATASGVTNSGNVPNIVVSSGGTLLSSTITNGYVSALQGATTSGNAFNSDPAYYFSGAQSIDDKYFAAGGYGTDNANFSAGSIVTNATASTGGPLNFYSGATVNGVTVSSGGVVTFSAGSVVSNLNILPGGSAFISTIVGTPVNSAPVMPTSGVTTVTGVWSAVLSGGKTIYKNAAGTALEAPLRLSAGTLYITSGATVSGLLVLGGTPVVSVLSGGKLLNSQINNGYVYVNGGGITSGNLLNSNPMRYSAGASSVNDIFLNSGYAADTVYALNGATLINPTISAGAPVVVSSGATIIDPVVTSGGQLSIYGGSATTCFLAGAMIETPQGPCAVEALRVGQEIMVYRNDKACIETVSRICKDHMTVGNLRDDDMAGFPVRIGAHSLGCNTPDRDLLVTAEHCLYLEGGFVPVRMLVNGQSIRYDRGYESYDYYHVELARHGIIRANNVLTESYLDTVTPLDNREGKGLTRYRSWASHGAASLRVERAFVEPIYKAIMARCGCEDTTRDDLDHDHGLYLVTDGGQRIEQRRRAGDQFLFSLPPGVERVRLVSRHARPFDTLGPFIDDRRELGVLVSDITLYRPNGTHTIRTHLDQDELPGWDGARGEDCRWTLGHATLPLDLPVQDDPALLSVRIVAAGPYCDRQTISKTRAA
ncbi:Hint domain-containing protein [Asaia bogorensis]|uniref:Hint domain-containing protein n=1 Tax=Asaia bogorensis TaxID=91915 RepID=UPI000EFAE798|nr:Hint domain-containing protein [Asaia bogorensis]